jgi:hypothetical protein
MRISLAEIFPCRVDGEARRLILEFRRMVEWWIEKARDSPRTLNYPEFRKRFYREWKEKWEGWNTQHAHTSSMLAYSLIRAYKPPSVRPEKPKFRTPVAVIHYWTVKLENGGLTVSTENGRKAYIRLEAKTRHQQKLLSQAKKGLWKIGQVILTPEWAIISFTKEINLEKENHPEIEDLTS